MPKFAISWNEENYGWDTFDSEDEAVHEAIRTIPDGREKFWVGELCQPTQPEVFWDAEDFIDHVSCQDDYCGEWAENWIAPTKEQRKELERDVREVIADWLDKHNLRPKFFLVNESREFTIKNGVVYSGGKEWLQNA